MDRRHQLIRFLQRDGQRLLAEDRDSRLDALHGRVEVHVVGRDDQRIVDPLAQRLLRLGLDHLVVAAVALNRIGPSFRLFHRHVRIRMQCGRGNATRTVKENGSLMRLHDECAATAADQSNIEWSLWHLLLLISAEE